MKYFSNCKLLLYSIVILFSMCSCSLQDDEGQFENSLVSVKLMGTQSQLSKVNLQILDVKFQVLEDETHPNAWLSLSAINTGIQDITKFNNNHVLTLVDFQEVPAKYIYAIKLALGNENTIVENNHELELYMSPEQQESSVNKVKKQLVANKMYDFTIEFEIDESVVMSSENTATLNPQMNTLMRFFNLM